MTRLHMVVSQEIIHGDVLYHSMGSTGWCKVMG